MTELSPEARALLDSARTAERPPPGAKARVHAALIAGLATGAAEASAHAGGAAATGAKVGGSSLTLKLLAPLAVVALGVGGAWVGGAFDGEASSDAPAPALAAAPEVVAEPQPIAAPPPEPMVEAAPAIEPEVTAIEDDAAKPAPTRPRPKPRAKKVTPTPAPSTPAPSSIREELELMRALQAKTAAGDGDAALALVRDHAERFPAGQLVQEREAARVLALCALDRGDDATAAARRFLERWPRSPQAARVRSSCAELP